MLDGNLCLIEARTIDLREGGRERSFNNRELLEKEGAVQGIIWVSLVKVKGIHTSLGFSVST